jgi:hypothetical protein
VCKLTTEVFGWAWGEGLRLFVPYAPDGDSNLVQSYNRESPLDLPRVLSVTRSATTGRLPLTLAGASTVPVPHCTTPYAQLGTR